MAIFMVLVAYICLAIYLSNTYGEGAAIIAPILLFVSVFVYQIFIDNINREKRRRADEKLLNSRPLNEDIPDFAWWMKNVEPKYENLNYYPPDWGIRRKYIAEIYQHRCGNCNKEDHLGHVHHVKHLKSGGTNELNNLVYLCRNCHENQHPHLQYRRNVRLMAIKRLGITEEEYLKQRTELWKQKKLAYIERKKTHPIPTYGELLMNDYRRRQRNKMRSID